MDTQESNKTNATEKLEEVQSELHCSICHDYFVQASTLSCSHSFCFNCINAWRQTHTDCPVCRREILGMAPSRALDNMVAAFVDRTNSEAAAQASLQQFGTWRSPILTTAPTSSISISANTQESDDSYSDTDYDWVDGEEEEDSYSGGSYDAEEEENDMDEEGEDEEDSEVEEEEDEDGSFYSNYSDDDCDDEDSDDEEYEDHAKRSNENNPNNDEYWRMRGWSSRPDNWRELLHRQ